MGSKNGAVETCRSLLIRLKMAVYPEDTTCSQQEELSCEEEEADIEVLRNTADQTRSYIDIQIHTLNELGNRAAKNIRMNLIIVSLMLTGGALLMPNRGTPTERVSFLDPFINIAFFFGVASLVISMIAALWAYTRSRGIGGLNPSALETIIEDKPSEREHLTDLIKGHKTWIQHNLKINKRDAGFLTISHIALIEAIAYLVLASIWGVYSTPTGIDFIIPLVAILITIPIISLLPYTNSWEKLIHRLKLLFFGS